MTPRLSTRNVRFPEFVPTRCLSGYGPILAANLEAVDVSYWRKAVITAEEAKAEAVFYHPPPPYPCNPAQPVRSGADRRSECGISNGPAASHL